MAAFRSGVTPSYIVKCFLRQSRKSKRGIGLFTDTTQSHVLQKSSLHTVFEWRSPVTKTLRGRRNNEKVLWVSAVAVRQNSTQIPVDAVESPPVAEIVDSPPVVHITPEQITVEAVSVASPAVDIVPPQAVSTSIPEPVPVDPAPLLTQPIAEQVADIAPTALDVLQAASVVEPTLSELGLANATPVGLVQNILESLHVGLGLPWWGAIVAGTLLARMVVFPVIIKGQREAIKVNNVYPEMQKLINNMNDARLSGNKFAFSHAHSELMLFQKKHDIKTIRNFLVPLVQTPIFISFFFGLRKMAELPVPSMQTGGALWFPDLTIADPFYILPIIATGTMFFVIELGADTGVSNPNMKMLKNVFRIMPLVILPLTINFPTAVFTYWVTSNCFSLGQVLVLKNHWVREKLKFPEKIIHPQAAQSEDEGFIKSIKKGWKNANIARQLEERERRLQNHLDIAAKGPLRQTFTHNPLQQNQPAAPSPQDKKAAKRQLQRDTLG